MELQVGRVAKAHGISGEVVVDVRTDSPEQRFAPGVVLRGRPRGGPPVTHRVEAVREHGGRLLVRFDGVSDRTAAEALRGTVFLVDTADLPPIDTDDEYYDHQLEGLAVHTVAADHEGPGAPVGTVTEVLHTAAGELLAVRTPAGAEVLVPFVAAIVTAVDLAAGRIDIDPPDGLLELG